MIKKYLKLIASALVLSIILFVALNWQYFYKSIAYQIHKPTPQPQDQISQQKTGQPDRVVVSSVGIDAPIVYVNVKSESAFQEALKSGVVHYPGTAMPGEAGDVYIFGHSSDYSWVKSS